MTRQEARESGLSVDRFGMVCVYHHTSREGSQSILRTGTLVPREDGVFFSSRPHGHASGYGPCAVEVLVDARLLLPDDEFGDGEVHFRVPARLGSPWPVRVKGVDCK